MSKRHPNPRLAKIHRNYTVDEVANLYAIHKNTVRAWVKNGLPTSDDRKPHLILGRDLMAYLKAKRTKNKQTCQPGQIYCVRCRAPKAPAGDMAEYQPLATSLGNLVGICPSCNAMIYRRVNLMKLTQVSANLDLTLPQALLHIRESPNPSVNSDLK